jgi:hypothetical protein
MKYFNRLSFLFSIFYVMCTSIGSAADNPAEHKPKEGPELKVVNLAVYPAPITRPAMKYHLLPRVADQTPGNAALLYHRIFMRIAEEDGIREGQSRDLKDEKEKEKFSTNADKLSNWMNTPLAELPKDDVRKILDNVQPWCMEYAEMASRRMQCDWELPVREATNPFEIRLPELHSAKNLARILAMKARLSLADGKPEDALKTLQIGFALSRQVNEGHVPLVNYLVGDAIAGMMKEQLLDLTQLKNAPNLYWSISNLPRPLLNYRDAIEGEDLGFGLYFCELQESRNAEHSPEHWQKLLVETIDKLKIATAIIANKDPKAAKNEEVDVKKILEENYPIACDYLIKLGWSEKEIRSMAPARVLLLYGSEMWNEMFDDGTKWLGINYSQWPNDLREHYNDIMKKYGDFPLADSFQVMGKVAGIQARSERDFDSLRCIEAIRLYAYSHEGKLPVSLDDIKEVPIPSNPMTGNPFSYHLDGDTAVLLADGDMGKNYEYRIKIAKLWIEKGR